MSAKYVKYFEKKNNVISMSGRFLLFFIPFVIGPISYWKKYFIIAFVYILVKRPLEKLHLHPQWGPDTHNSPHQRGASSKAEQPFFVHKNHFKNYQKVLNLWLDYISNHFLSYKLLYLMRLNIILQILKLLLNIYLFQMETLTGKW